jgi:hypothetical protein
VILLKSSVKVAVSDKEQKLMIMMDKNIDDLRRAIWRAIFINKKDMSDCDVAMALGLVMYELNHHSDEKEEE